jgi:hypothetical protein
MESSTCNQTFTATIFDGRRVSASYNWKQLGPQLLTTLRADKAVFYMDKRTMSVVGVFQSYCTCKYLRERLTNLMPWLKTQSRHHVRYRVQPVDRELNVVDMEFADDADMEELWASE